MGQNYPVSYNGAAPLEYGEGAPRIGVKTIALDSTTVDKEYEIGGNVLWVPTASDISATISIKYQDQVNDGITLQQGSFIAGPSFSRLYISWSAQAGETITLLYTKDTASRPFRIENAIYNFTGVTVSGTVDVREASMSWGYTFTDISINATTSQQIGTSNPLYREYIVSNPASNTTYFKLGFNAAGAAQGIPLYPGDTIVLTSSEALFAYNAHSGAQTICLSQVGQN